MFYQGCPEHLLLVFWHAFDFRCLIKLYLQDLKTDHAEKCPPCPSKLFQKPTKSVSSPFRVKILYFKVDCVCLDLVKQKGLGSSPCLCCPPVPLIQNHGRVHESKSLTCVDNSYEGQRHQNFFFLCSRAQTWGENIKLVSTGVTTRHLQTAVWAF